ncbi:unnamed protein product (macronuclear) [Paramecium tetraurelia]|uniref:RING-type domain-containing protein n=1 Tax=Paramecium tetraurelia TaxID=5888 RepID=A0BNV3_PARTE|nr:uncharacterized protein GSPATT00030859001 [Paramecium tetraurelia]CAK60220.1 unnamed protein product [Paramecium tetraurelia]|eukprot:XP_001427618.1 hypothetical protein (macronuclear) [Paramecium tetraurelia strain d4-2]
MKNLENQYKQEYPNLISCFKRNTYQLPLIKADLQDKIDEQFDQVQIENEYTIDTNLQIEQAEIFKCFNPEALNEALFQNATILRKFGRIRSLISRGQYLAVGSNLGAVLNFYIGADPPNKSYTEMKSQLLYAAEICQTEHGSVNQLSFNLSQSQLAVGFDNGVIGIYDLINMKHLKWVKVHQIRIVSLGYVNENTFVSGDEQGNCFITRCAKGRIFYDLDSQFIVKSQPMSIIRSIPVKCKPLFNFPEYTIVALGNGYKCWVLRIQDSNVTQFTILADFQNDAPENNQCILEWDILKLEDKDRLVLGISWTNQTKSFIFQGSEYVEGKIRANFKLLKEIKMPANFIYMNSIYNDLVLLLTEKGAVYTSNFTNYKTQKIMQMQQFEPLPLMYWKDNKYESQFNVCISNNEILQEIYILTSQNVTVLKYYKFEDKIRHFMENQQFLLCFQLILCIHKKVFMEFDRSKLLLFVQQIIDLYSKQIAKLQISGKTEEAQKRGISLVKFIIDIGAEQYLNSICDLLSKTLNDDSKFFLSIVESFIINKQFKFIPDEILLKLISLLKGQKAKVFLLLNQLDLNRVNYSIYLQACLESQLFSPMIYLCTHSAKNEFLTPLFQIWNYSMKQSQLENFEEEILSVRKVISFIEYILQGKLQDGQQIPIVTLKSTIDMMIVWIFEENNLRRMIWVDPYGAFYILYQIMSTTKLYQIELEHSKNMNVIQKVMKMFMNPTYRWKFQQQEFEVQQQFNDISGYENYDVQTAYSFFIIKLIFILKFEVEFDIMMDILMFCTFNKSFLFYIDYRSYAEVIDKNELAQLEQHQSHSEIIEYFQQRLMLKLVDILVNKIQTPKHKEQIEILNGFTDLKQIPLIQAYLYYYLGEYQTPVSIYLRSNNILVQKQVFKYLYDTLILMHGKETYAQLNGIIVSKLQDLLHLDIQRTRELICQFQKDNELLVIEKLGQNKKLQLKYIETVINKDMNSEFGLSNILLIKHIELLCELEPERVLIQLQKIHYPLEEVLEICKKFQNIESSAYVYCRLGFIGDAVQLQIVILKNLISKVVAKQRNVDNVEQREYDEIEKKMNEISEICQFHSDNPEKSWYYFLDNLIELNNQIAEVKLNKILVKKIGQLFEDISTHTPLDLFEQQLGTKYSSINIKEYKGNFIKMVNTFSYQHYFIQNAKFMIQRFFNLESQNFLRSHLQGYFTMNYCDICNEQIENKGYKYLCGHFIHVECKQKDHQICSKCLQSERFFLEYTSQKQKLKISRMKNDEQIKQADPKHLNPQTQRQKDEKQETIMNNSAKLSLFDIKRDQKYDLRMEQDINKLMRENI